MITIGFNIVLTGPIMEGRYEQIFPQEVRRGILESVKHLETQVAERTPVGVAGHLRAGIHGRVLHNLKGEVVPTGAGAKYADVIEEGRKPTTRSSGGVSWEPILLWVKRKIGPPPQELRSVAYQVYRKIHRRGFEGKGMFIKTERREARKVRQIIEHTVRRIERMLSD